MTCDLQVWDFCYVNVRRRCWKVCMLAQWKGKLMLNLTRRLTNNQLSLRFYLFYLLFINFGKLSFTRIIKTCCYCWPREIIIIFFTLLFVFSFLFFLCIVTGITIVIGCRQFKRKCWLNNYCTTYKNIYWVSNKKSCTSWALCQILARTYTVFMICWYFIRCWASI